MSKKTEKVAFIVILVLLVLFLPLTGYSIYLKLTHVDIVNNIENKDKEFFYDGKLWFYDENKELLGTYECQTKTCDYGFSFENDSKYPLDSFVSLEKKTLPMIRNRYVFIKDTEESLSNIIHFYDLENPSIHMIYQSVKNYQVGIENDLFIVESEEGKFGVLQVSAMPSLIIPYEYDFIGLLNNQNDDGEILADYFVALKDGEWMIIDNKNAKFTEGITNSIVDFNGKNIITKDTLLHYHLIDYDNNDLLEGDFSELSFVGKYVGVKTILNTFYLYDVTSGETVSEVHELKSSDKVGATLKENNQVEITINGNVVETIS